MLSKKAQPQWRRLAWYIAASTLFSGAPAVAPWVGQTAMPMLDRTGA